ncbi:unnamed protein product [Peronospora belbahrii]|uniref:RRM domain-containing protein n=1 Tax=Peronospora belbahrii TaxID=622444 RepID=A0ABN8D4H6_9STRA|nr:unnamed protein product [Peronospora belbahrii]
MENLVETEETCRVYVGNLLPKAKEIHLTSKFSRFGTIHSVWIARRPPGFAFVWFATRDEAERAVEASEDGAMEILGKTVLLTNLKSTPKDVARLFQDCAKFITSQGGVIRSTENRGQKRLGYGIEDRRWGALQRHYEGKLIVQQFNTSPDVLKELEIRLKNSFPIIRFATFKIRDPVDQLMNTRLTLEQAQLLLSPAAKAKAEQAAKEAKKARRSYRSEFDDVKPEDFFDTDDEREAAQFKQYVPDWKRDALFEPDVPAHLKDKNE